MINVLPFFEASESLLFWKINNCYISNSVTIGLDTGTWHHIPDICTVYMWELAKRRQ